MCQTFTYYCKRQKLSKKKFGGSLDFIKMEIFAVFISSVCVESAKKANAQLSVHRKTYAIY